VRVQLIKVDETREREREREGGGSDYYGMAKL
jgi:hypothetical protein